MASISPDKTSVPPAAGDSPASQGSFKLFRLARTDVFVHWSWFVAACFLIRNRPVPYYSLVWDVTEFLVGFGLVLLHEFGHVLACRSVGGSADRVVLWPLGGLAFVAPPPRPGATLWTIAAGPLVNLALVPLLFFLSFLSNQDGGGELGADLNHLFTALAWFNAVMLVFNLLPVFPLDGGRILQAVLWPWFGRAMSLTIAAGLGAIAGAGLVVAALAAREWWLAAVAGFLVLGAFEGLSYSRMVARLAHAKQRAGKVCPNCRSAAPFGEFWRCARCMGWFDLFAAVGDCPKGGGHTTDGACPVCGRQLGLTGWLSLPETELANPSEPRQLEAQLAPADPNSGERPRPGERMLAGEEVSIHKALFGRGGGKPVYRVALRCGLLFWCVALWQCNRNGMLDPLVGRVGWIGLAAALLILNALVSLAVVLVNASLSPSVLGGARGRGMGIAILLQGLVVLASAEMMSEGALFSSPQPPQVQFVPISRVDPDSPPNLDR